MSGSYKFFVTTLGCKLNIYESEAITANLTNNGWQQTTNIAESEVIIVNTCTVTSKADAKCRNVIRRCRKSAPNAIIIAAGCLVTAYPDVMKSMPEIDILLDNKNKSQIIDAVANYCRSREPYLYDSGCDKRFDYHIDTLSNHSRAFIKVQDGCTNFCTYCKIPYARGTSVSRPLNEIVSEVALLSDNGYREFVLTGVNIGMYSVEEGNFTKLLDVLTSTFGQCRFRVSSIEPMYVDDDFFEVFARRNVCAHLHIPLQSGSDKILSLMGRRYDCAEFESIIAKARMSKPDLFLSTDLIVGFPGEDDAAWNEIVSFVNKINFTHIHVFGYSPRAGTKAYGFKNKIPERIRDERVSFIQNISNENTRIYTQANVGKTTYAVIETCHGEYYSARTDNYLDIRIPSQTPLTQKTLHKVQLTHIDSDILYGEIAD